MFAQQNFLQLEPKTYTTKPTTKPTSASELWTASNSLCYTTGSYSHNGTSYLLPDTPTSWKINFSHLFQLLHVAFLFAKVVFGIVSVYWPIWNTSWWVSCPFFLCCRSVSQSCSSKVANLWITSDDGGLKWLMNITILSAYCGQSSASGSKAWIFVV